jgi:Flp pilus assembly protein TadD
MRRSAVVAFLIVAITLAAFARVGGNGFIALDDGAYVTDNPWVAGGLNGRSAAWAFTSFGYASNWHPLTWLSHQLDVSLFGLDAGRHHLVSLGLHAAAAATLFLGLEAMTGALWPAAFVALLFAVHPLHVESVAWAAERKDVLAALFWFLTMAAYLRYARRPSAPRHAPVFLLLALGLLAKPMLVTLPFVLLLLDGWPLGRVAASGRARPGAASPGRLVLEKLPLFALSAASSVVTYLAQQRGGAVNLMERFHAPARAGSATVAYLRYLGKTFRPSGLTLYYPPERAPALPWVLLAAALLLGLTALAIWRWRRSPHLAVGWLWYLGTLVPVIGLVRVGGQSIADRYTYLPLVGIFIALAWGAAGAARLVPRGRAIAALGAVMVIAVLVPLTWRQTGTWKDTLTVFAHALRVTRDNYVANANYALALSRQGRPAEALPFFLEAARLMPGAGGFVDVGNTLADLGRLPEAVAAYQRALQLDPASDVAHFCLGNAFGRLDRLEEAAAHYTEAARLQPGNAEARNNLGVVLARLGRIDAATAQFEAALRLKPGYAGARDNLERARALRGETGGPR